LNGRDVLQGHIFSRLVGYPGRICRMSSLEARERPHFLLLCRSSTMPTLQRASAPRLLAQDRLTGSSGKDVRDALQGRPPSKSLSNPQ
jgi:hypothetical protein